MRNKMNKYRDLQKVSLILDLSSVYYQLNGIQYLLSKKDSKILKDAVKKVGQVINNINK